MIRFHFREQQTSKEGVSILTWSTEFSVKSGAMLCSSTGVQAVSLLLWTPLMNKKYKICSSAASHHRITVFWSGSPFTEKKIFATVCKLLSSIRHFNLRILCQFSLKHLINTPITLIFIVFQYCKN